MNLLLDTHVLLWWLAGDPHLPNPAHDAIASADNTVMISSASAWEIAIKKATGRLDTPDDLLEALDANEFATLPITIVHALAAGALPAHHSDPFDRMLIAQSRVEQLVLVSIDTRFRLYDVDLLPLP
ncbi:MAG: type II toxin-antitoxin system VapC family toxin [Acidimicrobiales bacterium]